MARRSSSFGFMGRFGRSEDLRSLDAALREVDLHPSLVPEGVKLALSNLMKDNAGDGVPPAQAYPFAATLFGYCVLGPAPFAAANDPGRLAEAEARLEAALDADGFDADIVLLALHSRLVSPALVERYDLRIDEE